MDIYKSEGLSWADQWDPQPIPSETSSKEKKKDKDKNKSAKKILNFKWMKSLGKKSDK